eukprot:scaffold12396_cov18-Tisochrysis_lutea.AAC.1
MLPKAPHPRPTTPHTLPPSALPALPSQRYHGCTSACSGSNGSGVGLEFAVRRDGVLVGGSSSGAEAASQAWHTAPVPAGSCAPATQQFPSAPGSPS